MDPKAVRESSKTEQPKKSNKTRLSFSTCHQNTPTPNIQTPQNNEQNLHSFANWKIKDNFGVPPSHLKVKGVGGRHIALL